VRQRGRRAGDPAALPHRAPRKARPMRHGQVFWLEKDGRVLLRRRPENGLLGGMMEFPGSDWGEAPADLAAAPAEADWRKLGEVAHGFTHFELRLTVYAAEATAAPDGHWQPIDRLSAVALPTAMKKVAKLVLEERIEHIARTQCGG
jgi:A/G-specific adenine glycosylase